MQSLQRKKDHDYILLTFHNKGKYTEIWTQQEVSLTLFFSDANVFLVFLIIHVHAYNYEKLSIFICLLEMMLVVHVEFFTLITKLN